MTYKEVFENVKNLTQEFGKLESENVCTILPNCQEFHIVSLACQGEGGAGDEGCAGGDFLRNAIFSFFITDLKVISI